VTRPNYSIRNGDRVKPLPSSLLLATDAAVPHLRFDVAVDKLLRVQVLDTRDNVAEDAQRLAHVRG